MRKTIGAMSAAFGVAGAFTTAPIASANPQQDFFSHLDNHGVYYSSASHALDTGKMVCRIGRTPDLDAKTMVHGLIDVNYKAGFQSTADGMYMLEAASYLCPDIAPRLHAMFDALERNDNTPLA